MVSTFGSRVRLLVPRTRTSFDCALTDFDESQARRFYKRRKVFPVQCGVSLALYRLARSMTSFRFDMHTDSRLKLIEMSRNLGSLYNLGHARRKQKPKSPTNSRFRNAMLSLVT